LKQLFHHLKTLLKDKKYVQDRPVVLQALKGYLTQTYDGSKLSGYTQRPFKSLVLSVMG